MTIKALRSNYDNLSMYQRFALLDNAIGRGDESEGIAIFEASPKKSLIQADYGQLAKEIADIRLLNLITRLDDEF